MMICEVTVACLAGVIGDLWSYCPQTGEYSVSSKPDIDVLEIDVTVHKFVILATDGLWNVVRPSEATAVVSRCVNKMRQVLHPPSFYLLE